MSEKAILIGLITPKLSQDQVEEYLEEVEMVSIGGLHDLDPLD